MFEQTLLDLPEPRPQQLRHERRSRLERQFDRTVAWWVVGAGRRRARLLQTAARQIRSHGDRLSGLSDVELRERTATLRVDLLSHSRPRVHEVIALVSEVAGRSLGLKPYDCQLAGAYALTQGMVVEMETGEGKTLACALAAASSALAGIRVHSVTANDYLVQRDARDLEPLYRFLGLSSATILSTDAEASRQAAYTADVVHVTAKELAFDHLRDRLALGRHDSDLQRAVRPLRRQSSISVPLRQRGLEMAIVDEIDSILIDEARQPLIISSTAAGPFARADLEQAQEDAHGLTVLHDYLLRPRDQRVELTPKGQARLAELARDRLGNWRMPAWRNELLRQALAAEHLYRRNEDYVLLGGRVQIIDEHTGRIMPDRSWSAGLHELIELKEGCEPRAGRIDVARITYQRFFRRYRVLAGLTGTAREVSRELWAIYRLPMVRVPTHRPMRRQYTGTRIVANEADKWLVLGELVAAKLALRRPVLVGTRTVNAARAASRALQAATLPHEVLSADQNAHEAEVIARAGLAGVITIATNMAGRGTDIRLGSEVGTVGGLHVIMTEMHESGRIDRQLAGRCARQGDPGTVEAILSWDDPLLQKYLPPWVRRTLPRLPPRLRSWLAPGALRWAQLQAEASHRRIRRELLSADEFLDDVVAFSGKSL
jgi:preprotein translocase subunit SecA